MVIVMPNDIPPVITWRYERLGQNTPELPATDRDLRETTPVDAREIEIERDRARQILQDIRDALDERSKYYLIDELVLGVENYLPADVYCRVAYEESLEAVLDVEVSVVSGDVIEPVVPTKQRVAEYLSERDTDE
jgi:hypothetical protein